MKRVFVLLICMSLLAGSAQAATYVLSTTDLADFTGMAYEWENVTISNIGVRLSDAATEDRLRAEHVSGGSNYTNGVLWMSNLTYDLSTDGGGMADFDWTFDATDDSTLTNWSAAISVTIGTETKYYRWNHSNNSFNGVGAINFGQIGSTTWDDLSAYAEPDGTTSYIWGELVDTAGTFSATRINNNQPVLKAGEGVVGFGFIQWGASTGGSIDMDSQVGLEDFTVTIESIPEPATMVLLGLGGLLLRRRRA